MPPQTRGSCAPPSPAAKKCCWTFGGFFKVAEKKTRLAEIDAALQEAATWEDPARAAQLNRERARLSKDTEEVETLQRDLAAIGELLALALQEGAQDMLPEIAKDAAAACAAVQDLNLRRLFDGEHDGGDAFLTVQAGSGGTEAQDWAAMLYRMYWHYAERKAYKTELMEYSEGEVAGIKSATLKVCGAYAYGTLHAETGIHRLVRKSPFDSNHRRHTSFASVFVYPVIEDSIKVEINPADLRTDTYRASGAGGQHVNTTDSAVRITHLPTGIVVQCQNDRSQHKNRAEAMSMLRARLYQHELAQRNSEKDKLESSKDDISWGRQIRSYVLDQSRIKDLRSGHESGNPRAVLDGDLDGFIRAELLLRGG